MRTSIALLAIVVACAAASPSPGVLDWAINKVTGRKPRVPMARVCNDPGRSPQQSIIIIARLREFVNPHGEVYHDDDCDTLSDCDTQAYMRMDGDDHSNWPFNLGSFRNRKGFVFQKGGFTRVLQENDDSDSHVLQSDPKSRDRDRSSYIYGYCKQFDDISRVRVRVVLEDKDGLTDFDDVINAMNCDWAPEQVFDRYRESQFEAINCCTAFSESYEDEVEH